MARGWTRHTILSDASGDLTRDYVSAEDADVPGYSVFTRHDGTIRHFWGSEMSFAPPAPKQHHRAGGGRIIPQEPTARFAALTLQALCDGLTVPRQLAGLLGHLRCHAFDVSPECHCG